MHLLVSLPGGQSHSSPTRRPRSSPARLRWRYHGVTWSTVDYNTMCHAELEKIILVRMLNIFLWYSVSSSSGLVNRRCASALAILDHFRLSCAERDLCGSGGP